MVFFVDSSNTVFCSGASVSILFKTIVSLFSFGCIDSVTHTSWLNVCPDACLIINPQIFRISKRIKSTTAKTVNTPAATKKQSDSICISSIVILSPVTFLLLYKYRINQCMRHLHKLLYFSNFFHKHGIRI